MKPFIHEEKKPSLSNLIELYYRHPDIARGILYAISDRVYGGSEEGDGLTYQPEALEFLIEVATLGDYWEGLENGTQPDPREANLHLRATAQKIVVHSVLGSVKSMQLLQHNTERNPTQSAANEEVSTALAHACQQLVCYFGLHPIHVGKNQDGNPRKKVSDFLESIQSLFGAAETLKVTPLDCLSADMFAGRWDLIPTSNEVYIKLLTFAELHLKITSSSELKFVTPTTDELIVISEALKRVDSHGYSFGLASKLMAIQINRVVAQQQ